MYFEKPDNDQPELKETLTDSMSFLSQYVENGDFSFAVTMFSQAISAISPLNEMDPHFVRAVAVAMGDFKPRDTVEGMMAVQIVSLHFQIQKMMEKSTASPFIDSQNSYLNMATKLMKVFSAQLEMFRKYRQKGEQRMIVEHVNVHSGGQAIVGHVQTKGAIDE